MCFSDSTAFDICNETEFCRFELYKRIADMLVLHIRHDEETEESTENWEGVRQSQLVQWLLFYKLIFP